MKRVVISFCLLAFMIVLSVFFNITIDKKCEKLLVLVDETEMYFRNNEIEQALNKADELDVEWKDFVDKSMHMMRNDKISGAEEGQSKIKVLIELKNELVLAELSELRDEIEHIRKSEFPYIGNVF